VGLSTLSIKMLFKKKQRCGGKIWVFIRPDVLDISGECDQLFEQLDKLAHFEGCLSVPELGAVLLEQGDFL
jgi:hypothetical protein